MKAKTAILLARDRELLNNSLAVLMKGKYFRTMAKNTLRRVLRQGTYLEVPKGTILIKEGESDDDLYFLLDGALGNFEAKCDTVRNAGMASGPRSAATAPALKLMGKWPN